MTHIEGQLSPCYCERRHRDQVKATVAAPACCEDGGDGDDSGDGDAAPGSHVVRPLPVLPLLVQKHHQLFPGLVAD